MQFDVIGQNGLPEGLLEFVNNNRDSIAFILYDKYVDTIESPKKSPSE